MNPPESDHSFQQACRERVLALVPWKLRDVWIAVAVALGLSILALTLLGSESPASEALPESAGVMMLITAILFAFQGLPLGLAWVFGIKMRHATWGQLGLRIPRASLFSGKQMPRLYVLLLVWPIGIFIASMAFTIAYSSLVTFLGLDFLMPDQGLDKEFFGEGLQFAANAVAVGLWTPFTEEIFFRGFILAGLVKFLGVTKGTIISAALFSVAHMQIGVLVPIFATGLLLSWLYLKTRSIWPPMIAHTLQNSFVVFASTFIPTSSNVG
jgi:membrane protease YdiL (CAAX protease family)